MITPAVGVCPPSALAERKRLFQALSQALDVRFVDTRSGHEPLLASLCFEEEPGGVSEPTLVLGTGKGTTVGGSRVQFCRSSEVDGHLRGWAIEDEDVRGVASLGESRGAATLAAVADLPVWTTRIQEGERVDRAALLPRELHESETLQSNLVLGRFFGLLPLVAFLRSLDRQDQWHRPPVRASWPAGAGGGMIGLRSRCDKLAETLAGAAPSAGDSPGTGDGGRCRRLGAPLEPASACAATHRGSRRAG